MSTPHLTASALHFHRLTSPSAATGTQYSNVVGENAFAFNTVIHTLTHIHIHMVMHVHIHTHTHTAEAFTHKY